MRPAIALCRDCRPEKTLRRCGRIGATEPYGFPADQASVVQHGIAETDVAGRTPDDPPLHRERFAAPAPASQLSASPPCQIQTRYPHQTILSQSVTPFSKQHSQAATLSTVYVEQAFLNCQI
jgi:hypothetical protein